MDENAAIRAPVLKKRLNWMRIGIAVGIVAVIIIGIFWIINLSSAKPISSGDTVKFEYTIKFSNGLEVKNTSSFTVGEIAATFGFSTDELDKELGNISIGQAKTIKLSAADALGEYSAANLVIENRTNIIANRSVQEMNKTFEVSVAAFSQAFGQDAVLNKVYSANAALIWTTKAISISNDSVTLEIENHPGENLSINDAVFVEITDSTADKIKLRLNANSKTLNTTNGNFTFSVQGNDIMETWTPKVGQQIAYGYSMARIVSYNDTSVVLDLNSELAGQNVTITLKALSVVKKTSTFAPTTATIAKINGAPTLETFVMAYCPYGTQMEKGVLPAYKLLKDKANFEIRFVSYTMHGDKEDQENKRQLCIREEHNDKFWTYLECFLSAGDYAGCLKQVGLDAANIQDCVDSRADGYWDVDKALNTQYNVQGSPTTVLNGKEVQIYPRSPEDVKKAVCAAFASPPDECSQTLDSENPSAGFGFAASSASDSAASCG
jgi:FKBP-type peptidyl-prolyl cis-trans isomerase 2